MLPTELENLKVLFTYWFKKWYVPFVLLKKCKLEYERISNTKTDTEIAGVLGVSLPTFKYKLKSLGIKK